MTFREARSSKSRRVRLMNGLLRSERKQLQARLTTILHPQGKLLPAHEAHVTANLFVGTVRPCLCARRLPQLYQLHVQCSTFLAFMTLMALQCYNRLSRGKPPDKLIDFSHTQNSREVLFSASPSMIKSQAHVCASEVILLPCQQLSCHALHGRLYMCTAQPPTSMSA